VDSYGEGQLLLRVDVPKTIKQVPSNPGWHQGREFIAIGALENGAFCTVFSENFHKFLPQLQYSFFPSHCTSLRYKNFKILVRKFQNFCTMFNE
jgi:hypothetical protein